MSDRSSFTEAVYADALDLAKSSYIFNGSDFNCDLPMVCWRHDVDYSPERALIMARMEADRGLRCVYHLLVSSRYYNFLAPDVSKIFRDIAQMGHEIGLHFDMDVFYGEEVSEEELKSRIMFERGIVEMICEAPALSFSFHNHQLHEYSLIYALDICGMRNLASPKFYHDVEYLSDSNGVWRKESIISLLSRASVSKLQILTHPIWWTRDELTPYQRFLKCVEDTKEANIGFYREIMQRDGRFSQIRDRIGFE